MKKHGLTGSPEHRTWMAMMIRCFWVKPNHPNYRLYRGKGITVCERWLEFTNFLSDMGKKPTPAHTIDRINSDGNYEPGNCRWATRKEQSRNWSHRNRRFSYAGESLTISEWAERLGITTQSLRGRIEYGWPLDEALTSGPVPKSGKRRRNLGRKRISLVLQPRNTTFVGQSPNP